MLTFTKSFGTIFLGSPRTHLHQQPREVTWSMRMPQYFILSMMLSIGMFPQFYFSVVQQDCFKIIPANFTGNACNACFISCIAFLPLENFLLLFIVLAILIYFIRKSAYYGRPIAEDSTWGCGYGNHSSKMQYTGKSFSKSLAKLLNFIVLEKKKYKEISARRNISCRKKIFIALQ